MEKTLIARTSNNTNITRVQNNTNTQFTQDEIQL
jgi:hypothetical protein